VRGDAPTNTIEGYFSTMKRGINGAYDHVSQQHSKRYFDFRYNERMKLGVSGWSVPQKRLNRDTSPGSSRSKSEFTW
jgi:hypothetical protein